MKITFLIFILFLANSLIAQDPYAVHFNESNGLPTNMVYSIYQDVSGNIWSLPNQDID